MALLRQYWNRGEQSCPATDVLVEFHDELLRSQESVSIRRHIEACADCSQLMQLLESFGDESSFDESARIEAPLPEAVRNTLVDAAPSLAVPRNTADVKSANEVHEHDEQTRETGEQGDKGKGKTGE